MTPRAGTSASAIPRASTNAARSPAPPMSSTGWGTTPTGTSWCRTIEEAGHRSLGRRLVERDLGQVVVGVAIDALVVRIDAYPGRGAVDHHAHVQAARLDP